MSLLAALVAVLVAAPVDTVSPQVQLPEAGLDDSVAYLGYATRVYRDASRNALQIYLNGRTGRVVHVWADAMDESVGFTVRDSAGRPAALAWASSSAVVGAAGSRRSLVYRLAIGTAPVSIGLWLLGSMRVERDFQYQARDTLPLDTSAFPEAELLELLGHLERLSAPERRRELALLHAPTLDELRGRLTATIALAVGDTLWGVRVVQPSFDGRHHLWLDVRGDSRTTAAALAGQALTIRSRTGQPVQLVVQVTTDAPALTPLTRDDIFNDAFRRFYARVQADTAHPLAFRRLEREVRGTELLCYGEKLMAGLPNFATYFGRDMLQTALLMEPVWAPTMPEHVIASALAKLSPEGDVSHEEALGGQAIRENAAEYNRLMARGRVAVARTVLARLDRVRENYIMVDDDFQLPVVAARYLADARVSAERKRRFLLAEDRLPRLLANLAYVARQAAPYARDPVATNLVSFPRASDGRWISASWRDSRAGYAGGRFAMDVNAIWVPHALEAIGTILDALHRLAITPAISDAALARFGRDRGSLEGAIGVWQGAARHFEVALAPGEVAERVAAWLRSLPPGEAAFWDGVWRRIGPPADTLRFLALSLDGEGRPIPVVNTDPAMALLLEPLAPQRVRELVAPTAAAYPVGLLVDELGPLVANAVPAPPQVWESYARDAYHSPTVVWGRDVNILLAGLARQIEAAPPGSDVTPLRDALHRITGAVERSGVRHAELWSYRIEQGQLVPARYGSSSDVQLWSLTDLAVQYLLHPRGP
jgi:hypothetical protein